MKKSAFFLLYILYFYGKMCLCQVTDYKFTLDSCNNFLELVTQEDQNNKVGVFNLIKAQNCIEAFEKNEDWNKFVQLGNYLSVEYYQSGDLIEAEKIAQFSYEISNKYKEIDNSQKANAYHNLAFFTEEKKQYKKALYFYRKTISLDENADSSYLADTYNNIADNYKTKGDYENARSYFQKALDLTEGSFYIYVPNYYLGLARTIRLQYNINEALLYYNKCKILNTEISKKNTNYDQVFKQIEYSYNIDLSEIYLEKNELKKCIEHANLSLDIIKNDAIYFERYKQYELKAKIDFYEEKYPSAIEQLRKAEKAFLQEYSGFNKGKALANIINQMGDIYLKLNEPKKAVKEYHRALQAVCFEFNSNDVNSKPSSDDIFNKRSAVETLNYKAKALQEVDLNSALETYQLIADLIPLTRRDYLEENSKFQLADETNRIYEDAIKTCVKLYEKTRDKSYIKEAFKFAESSKAILLQEEMQANEALAVLNDTLQNKDHQLKTDIAFYEQVIGTTPENTKEDVDKISKWENDRLALKEEYNSFKSQLEQANPNYYALKYATSLATIETVQNKLDEQTAVIEYFVGSNEIYIFKIEKNNFELFTTSKTDDFENEVDCLQDILINRPTTKHFEDDFDSFCSQSNSIYKKILEEPVKSLSTNINNLVIVPDGSLNALSFDILLSDLNKANADADYSPENLNYLFEDYALCYSYSSSILLRTAEQENKNYTKSFIGFAPNFIDLNNSINEVEEINRFFDGQIFTSNKATFETFQNNADQYQIIHLSTHAKKNEENFKLSEIHFSDSTINNYQIENIPLNAELTVLSACETGSGKIQSGEGSMSLSRSFFLAGCPSLLSSLWRADEESTAEIMVNFYKNLKVGDTKDVALQKAKLTYCDNAELSKNHPFYWATFVQSGNKMPLF